MASLRKTIKRLGRKAGKIGQFALPALGGIFGGTGGAALGTVAGSSLRYATAGGNKRKVLARALTAGGLITGGTAVIEQLGGFPKIFETATGALGKGISTIGGNLGSLGTTLGGLFGGLLKNESFPDVGDIFKDGQVEIPPIPIPQPPEIPIPPWMTPPIQPDDGYTPGPSDPGSIQAPGGSVGGEYAEETASGFNFLPILLIGGGLLAVLMLRKK